MQRPERSIYWRTKELRQSDGLGSGVAGRNFVAGDDRQLSGRDGGQVVGQSFERACDGSAIDRRGFCDAGRGHLLHDVHRQCEKHRSGRRRTAVVKSATNQDRDLICTLNLLRPFDRRPRDRDEVSEQQRVSDRMP